MHDAEFYRRAIEKMFLIVDKDMSAVPFLLNPPQQKILKGLGNMDVILKARQEGISSLILAMFAVDFITIENIRCVVIAHEEKATQRLFARAKYFLDSMHQTWPGELPYRLTKSSTHEMYNKEKNSYFYIGTAGSRAFGRSDTINNLHISELALWDEQDRNMLALLQAVPKTGRIIIESTANGTGDYFWDLCNKARQHTSPFMFHFLPWFDLPDYVYPVEENLELTPEEQNLINTFRLTREQIAWRRFKINQMKGDYKDPATWDNFNQEFPATADEAFIMSGNPVFSPMALSYYLARSQKPKMVGYLRGYSPVTIEPNEKGYLKIWKEPDEFHTYAIGVDVAEGKMINEEEKDRDASCAQVFDKQTYELVATWHGRIDPDRLGRELDLLGRYYNDALIGVERNAIGITPLVILRDLGYPNLYYRERIGMMADKITSELGWVTDRISKEDLIGDAVKLIRDKRLVIPDEDTLGELRNFMRDSEGSARAAKGGHDDRVMAFLIGLRMLSKARSVSSFNDIERPDGYEDNQSFAMGGQTFNGQGWPIHPNASGDLYDEVEI